MCWNFKPKINNNNKSLILIALIFVQPIKDIWARAWPVPNCIPIANDPSGTSRERSKRVGLPYVILRAKVSMFHTTPSHLVLSITRKQGLDRLKVRPQTFFFKANRFVGRSNLPSETPHVQWMRCHETVSCERQEPYPQMDGNLLSEYSQDMCPL